MAASTSADAVRLRTGFDMPRTALGTWRSSDEPLRQAIKSALGCGVRHIDTAHLYFNEPLIGEALSEAFASGSVKREELFITSKLMPSDMHVEHARAALELTLKNLRVGYLDLYLLVRAELPAEGSHRIPVLPVASHPRSIGPTRWCISLPSFPCLPRSASGMFRARSKPCGACSSKPSQTDSCARSESATFLLARSSGSSRPGSRSPCAATSSRSTLRCP